MYIGALDILELIDDTTMTFTSGHFLLFLTILVLVYYLAAAKDRWVVLLIGSLLFAIFGGGIQVVLYPIAMTALAYGTAIIIENVDATLRKRRCFLSIAVLILVAVLTLIKCDVKFQWEFMDVVFPIGISYYTFSLISYLADVYWGNDKAEKNPFKLLLFVIFFPKIMQGPIARHNRLAEQLTAKHTFVYRDFCFGAQLVIWGVFKKLVIAERAGVIVTQVFGNYENYGGGILFVALLLEAVQLYCDFSGYMDIATGVSRMFGIALEQNFNHPFFSKSAAEFWRRWHITLGTWFKDYVYMPVSFLISPKMTKVKDWVKKHIGKQASKSVMTVIPLAVVWVLTGLWHGTGLPYIVWGIYWGCLIIFSSLFSKSVGRFMERLHINTQSSSWRMFQMIRTFLLFCLGQLITVPGDLAVTFEILKKYITDIRIWELVDGTIYMLGLDRVNFQLMLLCIGILWAVEVMQEKIRIRESVAKWNFVFRCLFYCDEICDVIVFGMYGTSYDSNEFLYMNF